MSVHWGGKGPVHVSRWSPMILGVASLDLNFLSGSLDSRVAFSRASTATVIDSSGAIQTSAIDSPRFDFDPVTLTRRGLLIEETRTNLFTNSLINAAPLLTQNVTVSAVPHTLSFYGSGTITLSGASVATVVGTGAYPNRRTITFTPIAGVLICTVVGAVQFAQLEVGSFATSFIPTGAAAVTRNADIVTMTGANFSSWYNQSEGTFVLDAAISSADNLGNRFAMQVDAGTDATRMVLVFDPAVQAVADIASVRQALLDGGTPSIGSPNRLAFAYRLNDFALSLNGGAPAIDTVGSIPTTDTLRIGGGPGGGSIFGGHIRSIRFFKNRLSNIQLQVVSR